MRKLEYDYIKSTRRFVINKKYTIYHNGLILNEHGGIDNIPQYVVLIRDCLMRQRQEIMEAL